MSLYGNLKLYMCFTVFFLLYYLLQTWNAEFPQAKKELVLIILAFYGINYFSPSISIKINLQNIVLLDSDPQINLLPS